MRFEGMAAIQARGFRRERRRRNRFRLEAPVLFHWKNLQGDRFEGKGVTRDISVVGAYVVSATCPPPNLLVEVEIILPPLRGAAGARIRARARVLRVEDDVTGCPRRGFSVIGDGFRLRTGSRGRPQRESLVREPLDSEGT